MRVVTMTGLATSFRMRLLLPARFDLPKEVQNVEIALVQDLAVEQRVLVPDQPVPTEKAVEPNANQ